MQTQQREAAAKGVVWLTVAVLGAGRGGLRHRGAGQRAHQDAQRRAGRLAARSAKQDRARLWRHGDAAHVHHRCLGHAGLQGRHRFDPVVDVADMPRPSSMSASALDEVLAGKPVSRRLDPALRLLAEVRQQRRVTDVAPCRTTAGIRTIITITGIRTGTIITHHGRRRGGSCWPPRPSCRSAAPARRRSTPPSASPTRPTASSACLDDGQRQQAHDRLRVRQPARLALHPAQPPGLTLGEMKPAQADAAQALFATVLNEHGLQAIEDVRLVEGVLREQQGSFRDPGRYYVSIFGTPGRFPWGWRLRGPSPVAERGPARGGPHHRDAVLRRRPSRDGARRPAQGLQAARRAEDLARQLMAALTEPQRRTALIADRSFGEIVASPQRETRPRPAARPRARRHGRPGAPARRGADRPLPRHARARPSGQTRSSG